MMNSNYHIIYKNINSYSWWANRIVRLLIVDKEYFYDLFVGVLAGIFRYLPLRPYMNNTGFKL